MAKKKGVYVYDKDCTDFTTTGLVGDLRPTSAVFIEEKNGTSELVIRMPYDKLKKWMAAKNGNLIKCEVPVRVPPVIQNDQYANTVQVGEDNA